MLDRCRRDATLVGLLGEAADATRRARRWCSATASRRPSTTALRGRCAFWDRLLGDRAVVQTPDRCDGPDAQPLAALPDARLPHLGPLRLLPVERRVRLPRSAAGRAGAAACRAPDICARAPAPRRVAAVRRRRRPALVARAGGPGRAHALLRRSALAVVRDAATTSARPATTRVLDEAAPFLEGRPLEPDEDEAYERPAVSREHGVALRTLRARRRAAASRPARTACR